MAMKLCRFELLFFDGTVFSGNCLRCCAVKHQIYLILYSSICFI